MARSRVSLARRALAIPYLTGKTLKSGALAWYWEPSPALRRSGWTRMPLGTDQEAATLAAKARNAEVDAWRMGGARPAEVKKIVAPHTMGALIARYELEEMDDQARIAEFRRPLAESTKRDYRYAFRFIEAWAEDGKTPIAAITTANIKVLKKALFTATNAKGEVKSHRATTILSLLNMLLSFAAAHGMIATNPMGARDETGKKKLVTIPTPRPRSRIIGAEAISAIRASALHKDINRPDVELGILLGLWTLQREADILAYTRSNWREMRDLDDQDRRVLAGPDGKVMALWPQQKKTHTHVCVPALPELRRRIEEAFAENKRRDVPVTCLVADPELPRATPEWKFQRGFRLAADHALAAARDAGDDFLVEQLTGVQFRDLRRTGMCLMRELGLTVAFIAGISGHKIQRAAKILETYMPAEPRANAAAIAMLATRLGERAAAEEKQEDRA